MTPRPIRSIELASRFKKAYTKLPIRIQRLAERKITWFQADAFDARLQTHALTGKLNDSWSFSVNHEYRILFRFKNTRTVLFVVIGTHAIYR